MAGLINSFWGAGGGGGDDFVIEITTIGASESFSFPFASGVYTNCTIDFGDGGGSKTISSYTDTNRTNIYATAGTYTITISADACGGIKFNNALPDLRADDIQNWGTIAFNTWDFYGCSNMIVTATDIPDFSNSPSGIVQMFRNCSSITTIPNMNSWDVSNITTFVNFMSGATNALPEVADWDVSSSTILNSMFFNVASGNPDITNWDISSVTSFNTMLRGTSFDRDIGGWVFKAGVGIIDMSYIFWDVDTLTFDLTGWDTESSKFLTLTGMFAFNSSSSLATYSLNGWDVSNVTGMSSMFYGSAFNGALNLWNTSKVTNMQNMFRSANSFNQDISDWDVSKVTTMREMFRDNTAFNNGGVALDWGDVSSCTLFFLTFFSATAFNQSVDGWILKSSGTINMQAMFQSANSFDQSLASWDVTYVSTLTSFMLNATASLSTANYDATLIAWELLDLTDSLTPHFGSSTYSDPGAGATAKAAIETDDSWTFTDGGGV